MAIKQKYPAIPEPTNNVNDLRETAQSLKQGFEIMGNQRGDPLNSSVTWGDLLRLGLVTQLQIPKTGT